MLSVQDQVGSGRLVCPVTHQHLLYEGDQLRTADSERAYLVRNGVPLLVPDARRYAEFLERTDSTTGPQYVRAGWLARPKRAVHRITELGGDHRAAPSRAAFEQLLAGLPDSALCLSVGGGPSRPHPSLVNLNIGPFPGVDVVGDACQLPYADASVDAVFCEAVLEHLERPDRAVAEMHRALRPGGRVLAITPFLQAYHGHPDHYQNFTLTGHRRLFERAGFEVLGAGVCVGPTTALTELVSRYAAEYAPTRLIGRLALFATRAAFVPLRFLDRRLNRSERAHALASTTYVLGRRREGSGSPPCQDTPLP